MRAKVDEQEGGFPQARSPVGAAAAPKGGKDVFPVSFVFEIACDPRATIIVYLLLNIMHRSVPICA
jgi:hypothetical protein